MTSTQQRKNATSALAPSTSRRTELEDMQKRLSEVKKKRENEKKTIAAVTTKNDDVDYKSFLGGNLSSEKKSKMPVVNDSSDSMYIRALQQGGNNWNHPTQTKTEPVTATVAVETPKKGNWMGNILKGSTENNTIPKIEMQKTAATKNAVSGLNVPVIYGSQADTQKYNNVKSALSGGNVLKEVYQKLSSKDYLSKNEITSYKNSVSQYHDNLSYLMRYYEAAEQEAGGDEKLSQAKNEISSLMDMTDQLQNDLDAAESYYENFADANDYGMKSKYTDVKDRKTARERLEELENNGKEEYSGETEYLKKLRDSVTTPQEYEALVARSKESGDVTDVQLLLQKQKEAYANKYKNLKTKEDAIAAYQKEAIRAPQSELDYLQEKKDDLSSANQLQAEMDQVEKNYLSYRKKMMDVSDAKYDKDKKCYVTAWGQSLSYQEYENALEANEKNADAINAALASYSKEKENLKVKIDAKKTEEWYKNAEKAGDGLLEQEKALFDIYVNGSADGKAEAKKALLKKGFSEDDIAVISEKIGAVEEKIKAEKKMLRDYAMAKGHPLASSGAMILTSPAKIAGTVAGIGNLLGMSGHIDKDRPLNIYGSAFAPTRYSNAITQGASDYYADKYSTQMPEWMGGGNFASWMYQNGVSALESAFNYAISFGLTKAVGLGAGTIGAEAANQAISTTMNLLMGSQSAADSIYDGIQSGYSNEKAISLGLIRGGIEMLTEKYSIDSILDAVGNESVASALLKSFVSEGSEEVASNWCNRILDVVALGDKNEFQKAYENYIKYGRSKEDAITLALVDTMGEDISSFLGGGLSGLAISGAAYAGNYSENVMKQIQNKENIDTDIPEGQVLKGNTFTKDGHYVLPTNDDLIQMRENAQTVISGNLETQGQMTANTNVVTSENTNDDIPKGQVLKGGTFTSDGHYVLPSYLDQQRIKAETSALSKALHQYGISDVVADPEATYFDPVSKKIHIAYGTNYDKATSIRLAHELAHPAQSVDSALVDDILKVAVKSGVDTNEALNETQERYQRLYRGQGMTEEQIRQRMTQCYFHDELVKQYQTEGKREQEINDLLTKRFVQEEYAAQWMGEKLGDGSFVSHLQKLDNNVIRRVYNAVMSFIDKLKGNDPTVRKYQTLAKDIRKMLQERGVSISENIVKNTDSFNSGINRNQAFGDVINEDEATGKTVRDFPVDASEQERYTYLKDKKIALSKSKDDSVINQMLEGKTIKELEKRISNVAKPIIKQYAKALGVIREFENISDTGISCEFSVVGLKESIQKEINYGGTYDDFARMLSCLDDLLEKAVVIDRHSDYKKGTPKENNEIESVFVLMSAFSDHNGNIVPVEFEVKQYKINPNKLYIAVAMTKIKAEVIEKPQRMNKSNLAPFLLSANTSITDIIKNVNRKDGAFLKYIPDQMLSDEQKKSKEVALDKRREKIEEWKQGERFSAFEDTHTPEMKKIMKEYEEAVDPGMIGFIQKHNTIKDQNYRRKMKYIISDVNEHQTEACLKYTGIDVSDYENRINGNAIDHIEKRHGKNGLHDHSMANVEDIARIGYVLENFDRAELLKNKDGTPTLSTEFLDKNQKKSKMIKFEKRVDGSVYVVMAVPDNRAKSLYVVSAYKQKVNNSTDQMLNMPEADPQLTPETPNDSHTVAYGDSIAENNNGVKRFSAFEEEPEVEELRRYSAFDSTIDEDDLKEKLKKIREWGFNEKDRYFNVIIGETPILYRKLLNIDNLDMSMQNDHTYVGMVTKKQAISEGHFKEKAHYHNLGEDGMKKAIMKLNDPDVICFDLSKKKSIKLYTYLNVEGYDNYVLGILELYKADKIEGRGIERTNAIFSIFEKENPMEFAEKNITSDNIIYVKKGGQQSGVISWKTQPSDVSDGVLNQNISYFKEYVNRWKQRRNGTNQKTETGIPEETDGRFSNKKNRFSAFEEEPEVSVPEIKEDTIRTVFHKNVQDGIEKAFRDSSFEQDDHSDSEMLPQEKERIVKALRREFGLEGLQEALEDTSDVLTLEQAKAAAEKAIKENGGKSQHKTNSMEKMGIKIADPITDHYDMAESIREGIKVYNDFKRETERICKDYAIGDREKNMAKGVFNRELNLSDIKNSLTKEKARALAERYQIQHDLSLQGDLGHIRQKIKMDYDSVVDDLLEKSDRAKGKNPSQISLNANTMLRNNRQVFGKEAGEQFNEEFFRPMRKNEANRIRKLNEWLNPVIDMKLNDAESEAVFDDLDLDKAKTANNKNGNVSKVKGKIDTEKVQKAVSFFQKQFDDYYELINDFLVVHGMKEIPFRKGYAPHLQLENMDKVTKLFIRLGIDTKVMTLPTEINGRTDNFKPNRKWNPYFLERIGDEAQRDIRSAYESYVKYISEVLYHTDDIMKLRRLNEGIRLKYSKENLKFEAERLREMRYEENEEKEAYYKEQIAGLETDKKYSNYVTVLEDYTNKLAGKQVIADRSVEHLLGRKIVNLGNQMSKVFAMSAVVGNVSSAINQLVQLPALTAEVGYKNVAKAIMDMISKQSNQTVELDKNSDFITGKRGMERINKTVDEKFIDAASFLFEAVDDVASRIIVRAKYFDEVAKGTDVDAAIEAADRFAEDLVGSRMKGMKPMLFESKNPATKLFTTFQLEVANQWAHVAQDLPMELKQYANENGKAKAIKKTALLLTRATVSTFVFNVIASMLYGQTPAPFDILGLIGEFFASGYDMTTNEYYLEILKKVFGQKDNEKEQKTFDVMSALTGAKDEIVGDIPFLSTIMTMFGYDNGRLAIPSVDVDNFKTAVQNMIKAGNSELDEEEKEKYWDNSKQNILEGILNTLTTFIPGGNQLKKTMNGVTTMIMGGDYYGAGDSKSLKYFVDDKNPLKWIQAAAFGKSALSENAQYWADGRKALSIKNTMLYSDMIMRGGLQQDSYDLIRAVSGAKKTEDETKKQVQIKLIQDAKMTDDLKSLLYLRMVATENDAIRWNKISKCNVSLDDFLSASDKYSNLNGQKELSAGQKTVEMYHYIDGLDISDNAKKVAKEQFKFYSVVPASAASYEKFVDAGMDYNQAFDLANQLDELKPEGEEKQVTNLQKETVIVKSDLVQEEQMKALQSIMGENEYSVVEKLVNKTGYPPEYYIGYKILMKDIDDNGSISQAECIKALNRLAYPNKLKAAIWAAEGYGKWKATKNPYIRGYDLDK